MSIAAVLAPLFVQIALTFVLLFWMGRERIGVIRVGTVRITDIALGQRAWPERPTKIANAYHNQFELPVLFYVLVALALITRKADLLFVVLAWVVVVTRLVHAAIFVTTNNVWQRFASFVVGALVLLVMWVIFALRILLGL